MRRHPVADAPDPTHPAHNGDGTRQPYAVKAVQLPFAAVEASTGSYVEALARLSLFADLPHPQLEALAHSFGEEVFAEGQRVIRQDVTGGGFYVILDGDAKVVIDGEERARLAPRRLLRRDLDLDGGGRRPPT